MSKMPPHQAYKQHNSFIINQLSNITNKTRLKTSELLVILTYPITILTGQILIIFSSLEQEAPLENYFTDKRNIINQLFVKKGWFWTLLLLCYFLIQYRKDLKQSIIRILTSTIWWYCFTQKFFGLPLMDRVFLLTGGSCLQIENKSDVLLTVIGSNSCRKLKGQWIGGHDPSGHVFLLVHSSLLMWFELLELDIGKELNQFYDKFKNQQTIWNKFKTIVSNSLILVLFLITLWWWMLLITSIHFHSFAEKISGLIAGISTVLIYLIPRFFFLVK